MIRRIKPATCKSMRITHLELVYRFAGQPDHHYHAQAGCGARERVVGCHDRQTRLLRCGPKRYHDGVETDGHLQPIKECGPSRATDSDA